MERFFNTAGPQTSDSYTIDPLSRFDFEEILLMIRHLSGNFVRMDACRSFTLQGAGNKKENQREKCDV